MPVTRWLLASLRAPCCSTWPTKPQAQAPFHIPSHEHGSVLQQCEILPLFLPFPSPQCLVPDRSPAKFSLPDISRADQ